MAKVSFILPAYKRRFLKEAITSILAQTYRDFELVVVDDCSPEDLKTVVDEFCDERLTYHRNEHNLGGKDLVAAWNHAMEYASGEWCVLASDDDVYHRDYLKRMVELTEKYPKVDLVHCRIVAIGENGEWRWIGGPRAEYETGVEMFYHCGVLRMAQRMPDLMMRCSAVKKLGGFIKFPTAWYTDHAMAIALSFENGAACSREVLFYWRESTENISLKYTDAEIKLRAEEMFRKWVRTAIAKSVPRSETDNFLLKRVKSSIDNTIDGHIKWIVRRLPENEWVRMLDVGEMSDCVRNELKNELRIRRSVLRRIRCFFGRMRRRIFQ